MARPKLPHPTPGELEILRILWNYGPATVRQVLDQLADDRAYTSVMSLLTVMADKKLVTREPQGRAFLYTARLKPEQTEGKIIGNVLDRVFDGSASALVARLLEQSQPSQDELDEIRRLISQHKKKQK